MIEAPQIRAARALLGIGQQELSTLAEVRDQYSEASRAIHDMAGSVRTLWKIQTALEAAGVEFIPADETKGPGVRLKRSNKGTPLKTRRRGVSAWDLPTREGGGS